MRHWGRESFRREGTADPVVFLQTPFVFSGGNEFRLAVHS
jgi:hypothetical protein